MHDRDLISVGLVLIGSSIAFADTTIGVMLPGLRIVLAPFLLLTSAVLIGGSAALDVFSKLKNPPVKKKVFLCRTIL